MNCMQYVFWHSPDNHLNKAEGSWRRFVSSQRFRVLMIHMSVVYTGCQTPGFPGKLSSVTHQRYASHFSFRELSSNHRDY